MKTKTFGNVTFKIFSPLLMFYFFSKKRYHGNDSCVIFWREKTMSTFFVTENGIRIKKSLFSSVEVPFPEIKSIVIASGNSSVTTKDGKKYTSTRVDLITNRFPELYDLIVEHNIRFDNQYDISGIGKTYSHDEVDKMIEETRDLAKKTADHLITERLGEEYSVALDVKENNEGAVLFFRLSKNGEIVTLPKDANNGLYDSEPNTFDDMVLSFLCSWDPDTRSGSYGVTVEMEDATKLHDTVSDLTEYFCGVWETINS